MTFQANIAVEFLLVAFTTIFGTMYNVKIIMASTCKKYRSTGNAKINIPDTKVVKVDLCAESGFTRCDKVLLLSYAINNIVIIFGEFFVFFIITDSFAFRPTAITGSVCLAYFTISQVFICSI